MILPFLGIYSSFFFPPPFLALKASRDPRIQGCERPWNRGYEDTRSARSEDFQGLWMFFCCRNERPRVRPWTNVHLSARDLQFNATASSRNASALSDEEGTTLTAQKKRLPLPRATLPSPCSSLPPPRSLLNIIPIR